MRVTITNNDYYLNTVNISTTSRKNPQSVEVSRDFARGLLKGSGVRLPKQGSAKQVTAVIQGFKTL